MLSLSLGLPVCRPLPVTTFPGRPRVLNFHKVQGYIRFHVNEGLFTSEVWFTHWKRQEGAPERHLVLSSRVFSGGRIINKDHQSSSGTL